MNWKYLVVGLVIILIPFAVLYTRISSVKDNPKIEVTPNPATTLNINAPEELPENIRKAVNEEQQVLLILSRGKVTHFDAENNTLEIIAENQYPDKIETRAETIDTSLLKQVKCWPETMPVGNGQVASIRNAYFPMQTNTDLYLSKETIKTFEEAKSYLKPNVFVFIKKRRPTIDTSSIAEQLAIIGC